MIEQILSVFVSNAYAVPMDPGPGPGGAQGGGMSILFMFGIFIVFMYFAVWRPQSKRAKEQQNLFNSLAKGDEVITAGGMAGRITKLSDQYISLSVANNVDIVMQKSAVVSVLPKGTLKTIE
jgi:preprotein translocase subunit YajC